MALNPEQFRNVDPLYTPADFNRQHWVDSISGKGSYITMSASDALNMTTSEAPRSIVKGEYSRTDWNEMERGETSINDFAQLRHSRRLMTVKLDRAKWGEPDSLYRHIQKHGIDKSSALWAMRNPDKPNQVMLTEGHHRLAAAAAIDRDMPIPVLDEGNFMSGEEVRRRFDLMDESRSIEDERLKKFIADPSIMQKKPRDANGFVKAADGHREIDEIQKAVKSYSLDKENVKPTNEGAWKRRF